MKLDCFLSPHKINSKRTDDLILKHEIRKYIEENTDTKLMDLENREYFIILTPKSREVKAKINEWDCIKLKWFCTAKYICTYIHTYIKRQPTKWDVIFANSSNKGLISKIYKELIQLNTKKNLIKKWTGDLN